MARGFGLQGAAKAERLAYRKAFIPKNCDLALDSEPDIAIYRYPLGAKGGYGVVTFWGSAGKPTSDYSFRDMARANQHIEEQLDRVAYARASKLAEQKKRAAFVNTWTVGTIVHTSWGYDQTNVDFFVITRVSKGCVWVRAIASDYEATGHMCGRTWPAMPIRMIGEETRHRVSGGGFCVDGHYCSVAKSDTYTSSYA